VRDKAARRLAEEDNHRSETPYEEVCRWETVASVRKAMDQLPAEQRQVVQMRIYEQKKFITIAKELNLPLGTVLTRMQAALKKLRRQLKKD
jgi:RNA polymerase sigma-70 factor (ECF subfamily)